MEKEREIIGGGEIRKMIGRLAREVENALDRDHLALVGIRSRGVEIAERLKAILEKKPGPPIPFGILDITLYRDDLGTAAGRPVVEETRIPFDPTGKDILLVDDVLYTGRTVRAALSELLDFGRPKSVKLLVLVDRNHRELPIRPDFTGRFVPSESSQTVEVKLKEVDGEDRVLLVDRQANLENPG